MVQWAKNDQMHSWKAFTPLALTLKRALGSGYDEHVASRAVDASWSSGARERAIYRFLTGDEPLPEAQRIALRPTQKIMATDGCSTMAAHNVVFRVRAGEGTAEGGAEVRSEHLRGADEAVGGAVAALKLLESQGVLAASLRAIAVGSSTSVEHGTRSIISRLPTVFKVTPSSLRAWGLWTPRAEHAALAITAAAAVAPRYFRGRQVLVPPGGRVGTLVAINGDCAAVAFDGADAKVVTVSTQALFELNQPHVMPIDTDGEGPLLFLEDGIRCYYAKPLSKVRLKEFKYLFCQLLSRS